jgi:hypothetical protein
MSGPLRPVQRPRGEPLLVLVLICGGWLALRVLLWQSPFGSPPQPSILPPASLPSAEPSVREALGGGRDRKPGTAASPEIPGPNDAPVAEPLPPPWRTAASSSNITALAPATEGRPPARQIIGHQLMLAAAFAHMEMPPEIVAQLVTANRDGSPERRFTGNPPGNLVSAAGRWTGDAWLLVRNGSSGPLAPGQPSYGRSQAGAVLRYRLAPASGHRPVAFVRATRALAGPRESEVGIGLAARPLAGLPVRVAGEIRVSQGPARREVRPAVFAVTELPPARLPLGLRAEAYAQAGYVGGHFATAFVDGQARIDAPVIRLHRDTTVRAGGAVWGGAQKHAGRLDVGPSAAVSFRLGGTQSRVAIDYRVRVAGNAEPKNGPALTISAGF